MKIIKKDFKLRNIRIVNVVSALKTNIEKATKYIEFSNIVAMKKI